MIIYRTIKQFDTNSGEEIGSRRVPWFEICDFTGERIEEDQYPVTYILDYGCSDPCFGDGFGEKWLYNLGEPYRYLYNELFSQYHYKFKTEEDGTEIFMDLIKTAEKEFEGPIVSLDQLLRWSRGRMLKRVIEEKQYKIEDFIDDVHILEKLEKGEYDE